MVKLVHHSVVLRVGIYAKPGFALLSYSALVDIMRAANLLSDTPCFEIVHVCLSGTVSASSAGASVTGVSPQVAGDSFDLFFVVAGSNAVQADEPGLVPYLRRLDRRGVTLGGVSGGPVILARAGLMAQRRMTVHWDHYQEMMTNHPELLLERALYIRDRRRMTCAGGTAAVDMMHGVIAEIWGAAFARRVADWFLQTEIRPAQGPQKAGLAERYGTANATILSALEIMGNHLSDPVSFHQLAEIVGVSSRQLSRLFQAHLRQSPMQVGMQMRIELAQDLLRRSSMKLIEIAQATGFGNPAHFSARFRAETGQSPSEFRKQALSQR